MEFYYVNHLGERINFYNSSYVLSEHTFMNWALTYATVGSRSTGFGISPSEHPFVVRIVPREAEAGPREAMFKALINRMADVFAQDGNTPGALWTTNGEYMPCRIVVSEKSGWVRYRDVMINCTLMSDYPYWLKPVLYQCPKHESVPGANLYLDYPYDYEYDYQSGYTGQVLISNSGAQAANFRITIYGAAVDPYMVIDGNTVGINTTLLAGEYAVIDSSAYEVYKVKTDGTKVSLFNDRTKGNTSIFEKIAPGLHSVIWPGTFGFDLTVLEERREPLWS